MAHAIIAQEFFFFRVNNEMGSSQVFIFRSQEFSIFLKQFFPFTQNKMTWKRNVTLTIRSVNYSFFLSLFVSRQGWIQTDRRDTTGWWTESTGTGAASRHRTRNLCLLTNMDARYPLILSVYCEDRCSIYRQESYLIYTQTGI